MQIRLPQVVPDTPEAGWVANAYNNAGNIAANSAKNIFAGPNAYADTAVKMAQARYMPAQLLSQVLSSPAARNLSGTQLNALINNFSQLMSRAGQNGQNANAFTYPPSLATRAVNYLYNKLTGQDSDNASSTSSNPYSNLPASTQAAIDQMKPGDAVQIPGGQIGEGTSTNTSANPSSQIGANTPAAQQASGHIAPGSVGGSGPIDTAAAQAHAADTALTGQQSNQNAEQLESNKQINSLSSNAVQLEKFLDSFDKAYKASFYKGAHGGSLPSSGLRSPPTLPGSSLANEQLADNMSENIKATLANIADSSGVTDAFREMLSNMKVNRANDPEAEQVLYDSGKAAARRMQQTRPFMDLVSRNNPDITQEERVGLLNEYNHNNPPFDYKTNKLLPQNEKRMSMYTTPEALKSYRETGSYNPYNEENLKYTAQQASKRIGKKVTVEMVKKQLGLI